MWATRLETTSDTTARACDSVVVQSTSGTSMSLRSARTRGHHQVGTTGLGRAPRECLSRPVGCVAASDGPSASGRRRCPRGHGQAVPERASTFVHEARRPARDCLARLRCRGGDGRRCRFPRRGQARCSGRTIRRPPAGSGSVSGQPFCDSHTASRRRRD